MIVITKKSLKAAGTLISAAFLLITLGACNNNTTTEPESERKPVEPTTEEQATTPPPGEPAPQPGATQQPGAAQDISDEDLNKFAEAYMAVQALSPQYQEQLLNATPEQANEIQQQAAEAMQKEIEKHDMTFEQFTMIAVQLDKQDAFDRRLIVRR